MKYPVLLLASFLPVGFGTISLSFDGPFHPKEKLSEYGFFNGNLSDLKPVERVIPYSLNTPLFSNYAEKARFLKLPEGTFSQYNDTAVFEFPVGTYLIKNFYYPSDFRDPEGERNILETRLMVNTDVGWETWPYVWNDEQTEAYYAVAGDNKVIEYTNLKGKQVTSSYLIPNKNQCKGCHLRAGKIVPIGPTARNLNTDLTYTAGRENQLAHWNSLGILPHVPSNVPRIPDFQNITESLELRARAYLDVNCGNCHNRLGPASTSGLFLDWSESDPAHLGVYKSPVAAGRGSGDFPYDISPGDPQHSILVFRMKTTDPGIAMPEIGREQVHLEGVKLIEDWIKNLKR